MTVYQMCFAVFPSFDLDLERPESDRELGPEGGGGGRCSPHLDDRDDRRIF